MVNAAAATRLAHFVDKSENRVEGLRPGLFVPLRFAPALRAKSLPNTVINHLENSQRQRTALRAVLKSEALRALRITTNPKTRDVLRDIATPLTHRCIPASDSDGKGRS